MPSATSPPQRSRWTEERVREELRTFLADRSEWPSAADFVRAGRRQLRDMVYRFGGSRRWARELGVAYPERRPGYAVRWTDDCIRADLAAFLAGRSVWPARKQFEDAGHKALRDAVDRTGGIERWSAEFHLPLTDLRRGSRRVWDDARIEQELRAFLANRDDWPTTQEFERAGLESLLSAIYRHGGGPRRWARRFGVPQRRSHGDTVVRRRYWTDQRIESELREFTAGMQTWPGWRAFDAAGRGRLYRAASLHGGIPRWRRRLRL